MAEKKTSTGKKAVDKSDDILYQLNGRPPILKALPISLQHILAMFTGNIAPILIICNLLQGTSYAVSSTDQLLLTQGAILMSGVSTLIQVLPIKIGKFQIGSGLPVVMGSAFAFVPVMLTAAAGGGIGAVLGASLIGGFAAVIMGLFIKYLQPFFPPVVIGSVLVAIGLNLLPTGAKYFLGGNPGTAQFGIWQSFLIGFIVFAIITAINCFGKGMLKNAGLLIGIAVGYIIAICMNMVDFTAIREAAWIGTPHFMPFAPTFHLESIVSFAFVFLILGLENLGNLTGLTNGVFDREPTTQEASGGIIATGLSSQIGSLFGAFPSAVFGQNTGIVLMTKIINRFCFALAGGIMVAAAFMPKIAAVFQAMPSCVLGGAVITVFGTILVNGIKLIARDGFDQRNVLLLSIIFGFGYALGQVVGANSADIQLPAVLKFIFADSTTAVCVVAVLGNLILPGRKAAQKAREEKLKK